jgi:glycosyltransferase involved in cell wall biosynthesis
VAAIPTAHLVESAYRLEWMNDPWPDVHAAGDWLLRLEQQFHPDVVHLNGYAHGALPFTAPVLVVAHSCVYSWWWAVHGTAPPLEWSRYHREVVHGLAGARLVVAPTHAMAAEIERHYAPDTTVRVIPNGRDAASFAAARLGVAKAPLVLSVGRFWDEAKNLQALAGAASHVPWPIYIAGGADDSVDDLPVVPLGQLSSRRLISSYAQASIYALPARYEPFGLSVLEAALCGCALVLGDIPSLQEVWGEAATFVPPGNDRQLGAAINALIEDNGHRAAMARAALDRAGIFTLASAADRYASVYRELAAVHPAAGAHACAS